MLKAVIFDVDGTLLDSVDQHALAWKEAFEEFDYHFPLPDIRYQIGKGGDKLLEAFLSGEQIEKQGKEIETFRGDLFKRKFADGLQAFPGVRPLFDKIHENGLKIALATSAKKDEVERYEKILGIKKLTDAITTKDDVKNSKPEPDVLQIARERLGKLEPGECVFIGDTPHDAAASRKDGTRMIGVLCGGFPEKDLRQAGAAEIFQNPEDLLRNWKMADQTS